MAWIIQAKVILVIAVIRRAPRHFSDLVNGNAARCPLPSAMPGRSMERHTCRRLASWILTAAAAVLVLSSVRHPAAEAQGDIQTARRLAVAAQQRARDEQHKAQAAGRRAAVARSLAAGYITYNTGAYYWGERNAGGQRDGYGIFYYKGGRCECRFLQDVPIGTGVVIAADGDRYEGELGGGGRSGAAAGYGVYTWADGRRFEGQFAADKPNGAGVLIDALGSLHAGIWKNGSLLASSRPPSLAESIEHATVGPAGAQSVPLGASGGGTYTIPVVINGSVRIPFVVDSGAADVVLPEDVVRVLLRSGTIDKSDLLGKIKYVVADGSAHYGLRLHIRELQVGDRIVRDVAAGVSPMGGDPLLGQTFLSRFGAWTIDNQTHALILSPQ
jgi:clan AA aspartic protease (TIGR02281 family)